MTGRATTVVLWVLLGLIVAIALGASIVIWRLSQAPLRVDFLTPYLEDALTARQNGLSTEIGETVLTWEGWSRNVDLRARDTTIRDRKGSTLAILPDVSVTLSVRALLQGIVAPTRIDVIGAQVRLVRTAQGKFEFGETLDRDKGGDFSKLLPTVLEDLLSRRSPDRALSYLKAVRITDGRLIINDRKLGVFWLAPSADISLRRHRRGLAGEFRVQLAVGKELADIKSSLLYDRARNLIAVTARIAELQPAALALAAPSLATLAGLNLAVGGTLSASFTPQGVLRGARFDFGGGPGEFSIAQIMPQAHSIRSLHASGRIDGRRRVELDSATLRLGTREAPGPTIALTGNVEEAGSDVRIRAEVRATDVIMRDLHLYWPETIAWGARAWVLENIKGGRADEAAAATSFRVPNGDFDSIELDGLHGEIRYRDLAVHYLRPLPPVEGVSGTGTFDEKSFHLRPDGGSLGDLDAGESVIDITGLDTDDERIALYVPVTGPLQQAVALLAHPRLDLVASLGLDPAEIEGHASADAEFRFPLLRDLTFDEVDVAVTARLQDVAVGPSVLGREVNDGTLSLKVTGTGMHAEGMLDLAGVPAAIDWTENFERDAPYETRVKLDVHNSKGAARALLGIDLQPFVTGPLTASLELTGQGGGEAVIDAGFDLAQARIEMPAVGYEKPPGMAASANLLIDLRDKRPVAIRRFTVQGGDLAARGSARFGPSDTDIVEASLSDLALGRTKLHDLRVTPRGDGFAIDVGGGVVDVAPFLKDRAVGEDNDGISGLSFSLSAPNLERVFISPSHYLERVSLQLGRGAHGWNLVKLESRIPREFWSNDSQKSADGDRDAQSVKTIKVDFSPNEDGRLRLYANANDMGAVLRLFDILETVEGGRIEIAGRAYGPADDRTIRAKVEAHDYTLVDAPTLARLLTLASLTGIVDVLGGEGIGFQRLVGDVTLHDEVIETDLIRAYGPALGITAEGTIDLGSKTVDLRGTVVPAYTINWILGKIPLLGTLLTGGKGEGIIAVNYSVNGHFEEPAVSVNPLSALTPGFLRNIFDLFDRDAPASPEDRPDRLPERRHR